MAAHRSCPKGTAKPTDAYCTAPSGSGNPCKAGFEPRYSVPDNGSCNCGCEQPYNTARQSQFNCASTCNDEVQRADRTCFYTPIADCVNTNPYGNSADCGYGKIKKKTSKKCPKCRCQINTDVNTGVQMCYIGSSDSHCNPSMN